MVSTNLKLITYRGGLVKFRVPITWIEEYESAGGGTFYENIPNSGTLRLNVLTFENTSEYNDKSTIDFLAKSTYAKRGVITSLQKGNAMLTYNEDSMEGTERLRIYYWQIANYVPPKHIRIAVFSYTILAGQESDPLVANELKVVGEQIPKATFALITLHFQNRDADSR
ncbi:MAG: hypothetical protein L0287_13250 [Anaerolineae bacterium]|nr:hypothetical protein [Anaerolineae bacterium]MCI0608286.1 hypothetical protein [Anaerolineae bacterium]